VQFVSVETVGEGLGWGAVALGVTEAILVVVGEADAAADEDADGEEAVAATQPASARLSARSKAMRVHCLGNMVLPPSSHPSPPAARPLPAERRDSRRCGERALF
jgi:hypothetical protein